MGPDDRTSRMDPTRERTLVDRARVDPSARASYDRSYALYRQLYRDLRGSFARIENSRPGCAAVLQRSNNSTGRNDGWVSETVDSGINYAYTQMGNNLNGRVSRAVLSCDGHDLVNTAWY